jgi:hypothetical protein
MSELTPGQVQDAAPHFLEATVLEELRAFDRLRVDWPVLQQHLKRMYGLTAPQLRERLHTAAQQRGESISRFAVRFETLRLEAGV